MQSINLSLPWFLEKPDPDIYLTDDFVVLDFETHNLDNGSALNPDNRLVCAAWAVGPKGPIRYAADNEYGYKALRRAIHKAKFIVAHNAKFELQWLARMGEDIGAVLVYDSMLGEYVLRGNRTHIGVSLDAVARRRVGVGKERVVAALIGAGVSPVDVPERWLRNRVTTDVAQTREIFLQQREELRHSRRLPIAYTRCLMTPVLATIEKEELALDPTRVNEEFKRSTTEYNDALRRFESFTGGINPGSPVQVAKYLYSVLGFEELRDRKGRPIRGKPSKQFPKGQPKTDEPTLEKLGAKTDAQRQFIALRKEVGLKRAELTKTLDFFKRTVEEYGGRFRGKFNQAVTRNHRLSSSGVRRVFSDGKALGIQFQNFPRKFKDLLRASREGWYVGEVDSSGAEFRAAGFLSQDPQIIADIRSDADIHRYTASVIYKCDENKVTKFQRSEVKPHTFKPLYGGQSGTEDEVRYYEAFKAKYKVNFKKQTEWTKTVLVDGQLTTPWGLTFYWPGTKQSRSGYIDNSAAIFNYPISSLATAEISQIAVVYLWHRSRANTDGIVLVNTVHDSAIADVRPDVVQLFSHLGVRCFTTDVYDYLDRVYGLQFNVPLGAGVSVGHRWNGDLIHEVEINVERDGTSWQAGSRRSQGSSGEGHPGPG